MMEQLLVWCIMEKEAEMKNGEGMGLEELTYVGLETWSFECLKERNKGG